MQSRPQALLASLLLGMLLCSCKAPTHLDSKRLFHGFEYLGSYSGDADPETAHLQKESEPVVPQVDLAYVYRPAEFGSFLSLGSTEFIARLKQQGFQIQSAPGIQGSNFTAIDRRTVIFVIDFIKEDCRGSLTGRQKDNGSELYILKLRQGC